MRVFKRVCVCVREAGRVGVCLRETHCVLKRGGQTMCVCLRECASV